MLLLQSIAPQLAADSAKVVDTIQVFDTTRILDTVHSYVVDTIATVLPSSPRASAIGLQVAALLVAIGGAVAAWKAASAARESADSARDSAKATSEQATLQREAWEREVAAVATRARVRDRQVSQLAAGLSQRINALLTRQSHLKHSGDVTVGWIRTFHEEVTALEPLLRDLMDRAAEASPQKEDLSRQVYHHLMNCLSATSLITYLARDTGETSQLSRSSRELLREFGEYESHLSDAYERLGALVNA
jgi:hypothetical protein